MSSVFFKFGQKLSPFCPAATAQAAENDDDHRADIDGKNQQDRPNLDPDPTRHAKDHGHRLCADQQRVYRYADRILTEGQMTAGVDGTKQINRPIADQSCQGGTLRPISALPDAKRGYIIIHKCDRCGEVVRNKAAHEANVQPDDIDLIIKLTASQYQPKSNTF